LKWHHFDPPWREKQHFNPEGMIALCNRHTDQADGGAYTKEQLRNFKKSKSQDSLNLYLLSVYRQY